MAPSLIVAALIGSTALVGVLPSASAATCSVSANQMSIQLDAETVEIREPGNTITVNGVFCANTADVDAVLIAGANGHEADDIVHLYLQGFPDASRITWSVTLGPGNIDRLLITGGTAAVDLRAGTLADGSLGVDIDANQEADITGTGVERLQFDGKDAADRFSGRLPLADGVHPLASMLQVRGGAGDDVITGGNGPDILHGNGGNDIIRGGGGLDEIYGEGGNDELYGNGGGDYLFGGNGEDYLDGGAGNDQVHPEDGVDTALGGGGDDSLWDSEGLEGDSLDGGAGIDSFGCEGESDVTIDLGSGYAQNAFGTDALVSIEDATGGDGNDTLIGDDGPNDLNGGAGDDTLIGGAGLDYLECGLGIDAWSDAMDTTYRCENPL